MRSVTEYRGQLSAVDQQRVQDYLLAGGSVRGASRDLGIPYKQVRTFASTVLIPEALPNEHFRVLFFDIENAPFEAYSWKADVGYIGPNLLKAPGFVVAWSAKWYREPEVITGIVTPEEAVAKDDSRIIAEAARLLTEADIIVGHNVNKHDLPIIAGRLAVHQFDPLPPLRTIDTLFAAKRDLGLPYNGMDMLCEVAGIEPAEKIGMRAWKRILEQGDPTALAAMAAYSARDAETSEELFEWMKPHIKRMTRLVDGPGFLCPFCAKATLVEVNQYGDDVKPYRTQVSTFKMWLCDNCRRYSRSKSLADKRHPLHPL